MVKKIIITFILFGEIFFLQKLNILNQKIVNAVSCGHLNEICCQGDVCNDDLVCRFAGTNLPVMMCFDKEDYVEFEEKYPNSAGNPTIKIKDKIFCNLSGKATSDPASGRIYTAIGCIPVSSTPEFIEWILGWAIGVGGGIALMLIIVASFQIMTSSGNPEKVQAGKELLTSAIAGLIMLIFAVFILKIIGIDILKLPGIN